MYRTFLVWLTLIALTSTLTIPNFGMPQMAYSTSLGDSIREEVKERVESGSDNDENREERSGVNDDDEARDSDSDDDESSNDPGDGLDKIMDQVKDRDNGNNNNQDDDGVQGSPSIDDLASPFFEGTDVKSVIDYIAGGGDRSTDGDLEEFLNPIRNSGSTNTGDLFGSPGNGGSSSPPGSALLGGPINDIIEESENMEGPTDFPFGCIRACFLD
jgi:hypothetical protein